MANIYLFFLRALLTTFLKSHNLQRAHTSTLIYGGTPTNADKRTNKPTEKEAKSRRQILLKCKQLKDKQLNASTFTHTHTHRQTQTFTHILRHIAAYNIKAWEYFETAPKVFDSSKVRRHLSRSFYSLSFNSEYPLMRC